MKKRKLRLFDKMLYYIVRFISFVYTRVFLGFRCKDKYKKAKNETCIILSNHQTDYDPFCMMQSFPFFTCAVATDNIFINKFVTNVLKKIFHVIPKKKGTLDKTTIINIVHAIKDGNNILLFPEGNRTYAEFQYYITPDFPRFLKLLKSTIILYNIHGGCGVRPRFSSTLRKGKFYGKIKRVLKYDEYKDMPNDELYSIIKNDLKVYDSESKEIYKSKKRGEYLERMFFVCPICKTTSSLYSKNEFLICKNCSHEIEYNEDLTLSSKNSDFSFSRLVDYWNYQKRYIKSLDISNDKPIFTDENIKLIFANPFVKRKCLYKGNMSISYDGIRYGDVFHEIGCIENASIISGQKLVYTYNGNDYLVRGNKRFNPVKYILLFSKLETKIKIENREKYYNLEEDIC